MDNYNNFMRQTDSALAELLVINKSIISMKANAENATDLLISITPEVLGPHRTTIGKRLARYKRDVMELHKTVKGLAVNENERVSPLIQILTNAQNIQATQEQIGVELAAVKVKSEFDAQKATNIKVKIDEPLHKTKRMRTHAPEQIQVKKEDTDSE